MITVTDIFNNKGQHVRRIAKCDCKPWLTWLDFIIGTLGALVAIAIMYR